MPQRFREALSLALLALLPFHALLVTVGTKLLLGPGHAPLTALALWKEAVLGIILLLAFVDIVRGAAWKRIRPDLLDGLVAALCVLALLVQALVARQPLGGFLLGARYDLLPLVAFVVLRRVPWSHEFRARLVPLIVIIGGIVALLALLSAILPLRAFVWLGYADLHSLYLPDQPLAPYQQIGESWVRRVQGPMSGPNQLGIWLLLVLSALLSFVCPTPSPQRRAWFGFAHHKLALRFTYPLLSFVWATKERSKEKRTAAEAPPLGPAPPRPASRDSAGLVGDALWRRAFPSLPACPSVASAKEGGGGAILLGCISFLSIFALFLTFSRAAWIAAFVLVVVTLQRILPRRTFARSVGGTAVALIVLGIVVTFLFPHVFLRLSSTRGHWERPIDGIRAMIAEPLGRGLGSAGPASNKTSEACVFLRPQDDPSWAKSQPELCVFLGTTQVQPADHACRCPFLTENWYIQMGVELGVLGFSLFLALTVAMLLRLSSSLKPVGRIAFLFFLGVAVAALFLHAWEDAAVAFTGWFLAAVAISMRTEF